MLHALYRLIHFFFGNGNSTIPAHSITNPGKDRDKDPRSDQTSSKRIYILRREKSSVPEHRYPSEPSNRVFEISKLVTTWNEGRFQNQESRCWIN